MLPAPEEKQAFVRRMFGDIARRYDLLNRIMTMGQDIRWRRMAVKLAEIPSGGRVLDVATGTGDMAYEAIRSHSDTQVVGMDFTPGMLAVGVGKYGDAGVRFVLGDALQIPFPDDSFDAVLSGFMMRNVTDIARAFEEQRRVVRPGGRVVCLETTRPATPIWKDVFHFYFFQVVPILGQIVGGRRAAYTYLPHSTVDFPRPDGLKDIMESAGLRDVTYRTMMLGTVALHVGVK